MDIRRKTLPLLLLYTCISFTEQQGHECGRCPDGWIYFRDSCYLFAENIQQDWTAASHYCFQHHGSILVNIETAEENMFLQSTCRRLRSDGNAVFWTGASDSTVEGIWEWYPDNTLLEYKDWAPGEPSTTVAGGEDCMNLYEPENYHWNDGDCSYNKGHPLCELRLDNGPMLIGK